MRRAQKIHLHWSNRNEYAGEHNAINKIHSTLIEPKEILTRPISRTRRTSYSPDTDTIVDFLFLIRWSSQSNRIFSSLFFYYFFLSTWIKHKVRGKSRLVFSQLKRCGQNAWWALMGTMFRSRFDCWNQFYVIRSERFYVRCHGSRTHIQRNFVCVQMVRLKTAAALKSWRFQVKRKIIIINKQMFLFDDCVVVV